MYSVYVIVVTYKGKKWYDRCFSSLLASNLPLHIVAIDNASNDGSVEFITKNYPGIKLIECKENLGFGRGNNLGLSYALTHECDYVFLLNQDAWIEPNTIETLVSIHQHYKEYGILSPMHLNVDKTGLVMKHFCRQPDNEKLITDLYFNRLTDIYETKYIHAAAWLLPRNTLEIVGGFDPIFTHYEEDDDYLNRVRFHKLKIGVCPSARIIHDHKERVVNPFNSNNRYRHEQALLVQLTNLNSSESITQFVLYTLRKSIVSLLKGDFSNAGRFWKDLLFTLKSIKSIKNSRQRNSMKARTWIE